MKNFFIKCGAALVLTFGFVVLSLGFCIMCLAFCIAFCFIPVIWILAKVGCPGVKFNDNEWKLGPFIKFTLNPKR